MERDLGDVVVPAEPGLHLVVDRPQGPGTALLHAFAENAVGQGVPALAVLLDQGSPQFRAELSRRGLDVNDAEDRGLLSYVDAHAPRVGWAHTAPATVFVEAEGPDALLLALAEAQSALVEHAPEHLLVVDSLSSLLVLEGLPATYAFAQALSSFAPRLGAVTVGRVVAGMHEPEEVTALAAISVTVTDLSGEVTARSEVRAPKGPQHDRWGR